jgi:hypothetical protein
MRRGLGPFVRFDRADGVIVPERGFTPFQASNRRRT